MGGFKSHSLMRASFLVLFLLPSCGIFLSAIPHPAFDGVRAIPATNKILKLESKGKLDAAYQLCQQKYDEYSADNKHAPAISMADIASRLLIKKGDYESLLAWKSMADNTYEKMTREIDPNTVGYGTVSFGAIYGVQKSYASFELNYINAFIRLGDYQSAAKEIQYVKKNIFPPLEKWAAVNSQHYGNTTHIRNNSIITKSSKALTRFLIPDHALKQFWYAYQEARAQLLVFEIMVHKFLSPRPKGESLWHEYKTEHPASGFSLSDSGHWNPIYFYAAKAAWLMEDGEYLLHSSKLVQRYNIEHTYSPYTRFWSAVYFAHYLESTGSIRKDFINYHGLFWEAEALRMQGEFEAAIHKYNEYIQGFSAMSELTLFWKAFDGLGRCYEEHHRWQKAIKSYSKALNILEKERNYLSKDAYKLNFLLNREHPYNRYVYLKAGDDPDKAPW